MFAVFDLLLTVWFLPLRVRTPTHTHPHIVQFTNFITHVINEQMLLLSMTMRPTQALWVTVSVVFSEAAQDCQESVCCWGPSWQQWYKTVRLCQAYPNDDRELLQQNITTATAQQAY